MSTEAPLQVDLEPRSVTLHYPGAEGVRFQDAVLVLRTSADTPVDGLHLRLRVEQPGKVLMDGPVDLAELGAGTSIPQGEPIRLSVFRALQHHVPGFGSKVNLFGYKAVLNWKFGVEASLSAGSDTPARGAWDLEWRPAEAEPDLVEVDLQRR